MTRVRTEKCDVSAFGAMLYLLRFLADSSGVLLPFLSRMHVLTMLLRSVTTSEMTGSTILMRCTYFSRFACDDDASN